MRRTILLAFILASHVFAQSAYAGDEAVLSTTREIAKQGLMAYDEGRYDDAVEKLSKAYEVVKVPTLAVALARALAKTGKMVAASELYLEAARIPKDESWQPVQNEAQQDAEKERQELLERIPRLKIMVEGAKLADVALTVDGAALPTAIADAEQLVDPGERSIEGTRGGEVVTRSVTVKEGEHAEVVLEFTAAGVEEGVSGAENTAIASPSAADGALDSSETDESDPGHVQRLLGWTGIIAGGVGVAVGATTGLLAISKRSSILDSGQCTSDDRSCTSDVSGDIDAYNGLRSVSSIGFIAGGVLAATGVTLLLTAPKQESAMSAGIWVGPSSAGFYGGF